MGEDPHFNDINYANSGPGASLNKVRMRNNRGEYVSLDSHPAMGRFNNSRTGEPAKRRHISEARKAEMRLRRIEQISKYREEKIKKEFLKLEADLRAEDERKMEEGRKEKMRQGYLEKQRGKLAEWGQTKAMMEQERRKKEFEKKQKEVDDRNIAIQRNELQK